MSDGNDEEEAAEPGDGKAGGDGAAPEDEEEEPFMNKLVIDADNPIKSYFDVTILLFVGYSCIQSLYTVAFTQPTAPFFLVWDWVVEGMFYCDLVLSFFHAYIDEDTQAVVTDWNMIYKRYLGSWFIIDFVSVFPFQTFLSGGVMLKLVRLARMPRLLKLLDPERFKKVVRSFENDEADIEDVLRRDYILFFYNIFRLCTILVLLTYGFGCINFFMSEEGNSEEAKAEGKTFILANNLNETSDSTKLVVTCYFALTTLSTVGYGDYYPISTLEMLMTVTIQLCGVAFFSYIMDTFMKTMEKFKKKVTDIDKTDQLVRWLLVTQIYQQESPIDRAFLRSIDKEMEHFWANDRLQCFEADGPDFQLLPISIKVEILAEHLFSDLRQRNLAFFMLPFSKDLRFIYNMLGGLRPRDYQEEDDVDRMIALEDQPVDEMVFVMSGRVGIAFTRADSFDPDAGGYYVSRVQKGSMLICDYYVLSKKRSNFFYLAVGEDVFTFTLSRKYIWNELFDNRNEDYLKQMVAFCKLKYTQTIYKKVSSDRKQHIIQVAKSKGKL